MYGLLAGLFWAIDTVVLSYSMNSVSYFFIPLLITCLHDLCSFVYLMISVIIKKEYKIFIQCLFNKKSKYIILGALLGGPIGMGFYVLSLNSISADFCASVSAFYPALGALFSYILLKEKMSFIQIIGLLLSITGVILLGFNPNTITLKLGFIYALICTLGWSLEAVIVGYGLKNSDIKDEYALTLRQGTSSIVYLCIIPLIISNSISVNYSTYFIVSIAALFGTLSYLFYYKSIVRIGAFLSMALNITYSAFAIIITSIITLSLPDIKSVFCTLLIIGGTILSYVKRVS